MINKALPNRTPSLAPLVTSLVLFLAAVPHSQSLSSPKSPQMKYTDQPDHKKYDGMRITSLHRYAIKGLSGDSVSSLTLNDGDGAFEDDRRFALLYDTSSKSFDGADPVWLHKENFLCAFTAPELLATLDTEYRIETPGNNNNNNCNDAKRLLTIWNRKLGRSSTPVLGPVDMACLSGREETSRYFTELCGRKVQCVVASDYSIDNSNRSGDGDTTTTGRLSNRHSHQFGNTSSGVKNNKGDTRTIHIVNENTVRELSKAIYGEDGDKQHHLSATRFRPNIIIDDLEPWAEFDLIGKTIEVVPKVVEENDVIQKQPPLRLQIVSRTVRCAGVGVDPLHPELGPIDIPKLLAEHFPQHGPYLGVYCVVDNDQAGACERTLTVDNTFHIVA